MDYSSYRGCSTYVGVGKRENLRGIVYKMDNLTERALVRVMIEQDVCSVHDIASKKYNHIDINHLYIPYCSIGSDNKNIELGSIVKIFDYDGRRIRTSIELAANFTQENPAEITTYSVVSVERQSDQLVAVTSVHHNYLKVVRSGDIETHDFMQEDTVAIPRDAYRIEWKQLPKHSFMYADQIFLPKHYKIILIDEAPQIIFDHVARASHIEYSIGRGLQETGCRLQLITKIRQLTRFEKEAIQQQTRNASYTNNYLADKYVFEPLFLCAILEEFLAKKSEEQFTCQVSNLEFDVDRGVESHRSAILVPLTDSVRDCLTTQGRNTWHHGSELMLIVSPEFVDKLSIAVVVEKTDWKVNGNSYVRLIAAEEHDYLFDALRDCLKLSKMDFQLEPKHVNSSRLDRSLRSEFEMFVKDRNRFFEAFIGRSTASNVPLNVIEDIELTDQKLDESQRLAVRTAIGETPGFTCVSAPPGSGKTFLISQIIAEKHRENPSARFALVATTNFAVTNAVDMIRSEYPEIKCIRQFSQKAEEELDKKAPVLDISLRRMIRNQKLIKSLVNEQLFADTFLAWEGAMDALQEQDGVVEEWTCKFKMVANLYNAEVNVGVAFVRHYAPTVFATTSSLITKTENLDISHLIVDEASQLSQIDALIMYMRLPDIKHITLVGDSQQLGPFTDINKGTLAYEIMQKGELTRLENLESSAKTQLEYIYRAHPRIMDLLLKPIYGPQLKSGTAAIARNMAEEYNLPRAKNGSPCLFVHIDGVELKGRNNKEVEVVLAFLKELHLKGIAPEDVSIIVHHKAQKDNLCKALKDQGSVGRLNMMYNVNTIDSYQGQEAKIVLVLTTKTCGSSDFETRRRTLSFVSEPQRGTVAVSRAQHAIYIFGNWNHLASMPFWSKFGDGIRNSGAIVDENWQSIHNAGWSS